MGRQTAAIKCADPAGVRTSPLTGLLFTRIRESGPVDIGTFMSLALGHPVHGYYMTRDPFGAKGDFTTAPEISQMFGETLGAWAADVWVKLGAPSRFSLVECGPGRGTLMADALRATRRVPGFHASLAVHLVETSPVLRAYQERALKGFAVTWHDTLETLPANGPLVLLANEFLDALPVRQIVKTASGWAERALILDAQGSLAFGISPAPDSLPPLVRFSAREGDIAEIAPERTAFVRSLAVRLRRQKGAALFVDYGYERPASGETLQAVKNHAFAPVLEEIGRADLTAHVDFSAIAEAARVEAVSVYGPVAQGSFLERLGLMARADIVLKAASPVQAKDIREAAARLLDPAQMGGLFKVLALYEGLETPPEGFS